MADASVIGGASPSTPGSGGVFESLGPLFNPGYRVVIHVPLPSSRPTTPPAFSDPRGILPAGLVPASQFSYQILDEVFELAVTENSAPTILGVIGALLTGGQITVNSKSTVSVILFEGRDVIDLPTTGLASVSGGVQVPDNVFLPIFTGGKFISPGDDIGNKAALEYIKKSPSNSLIGIAPSANAPLDSLSNPASIFPAGNWVNKVDVASNVIKTNGFPSFVSYVSCDKPIYRDVVTMNSSAIAQGTFSGSNLTITLVAPFGESVLTVLRYAYVNFVTDPKSPPMFNWRLSESFGVAVPKAEKTPNGLKLSITDAVADALDEKSLHYVYNLNDEGDDVARKYPLVPAKTAYSPALAKAKSDSTSPFFDKNFKSQVYPFAKNQSFFQSRLSIDRVFGLSEATASGPNRIITDRSYLSPANLIDLGPNTRFGVEYIFHQFSHSNTFTSDDVILLASTKPAVDGISTYYDPCIKMIVVLLAEEQTVTQRLFNDKQWAVSSIPLADSTLKQFLLGESPQQSEGTAAICPFSQDLNLGIKGEKGTVTIPNGIVPTAVLVNGASAGDKAAVLQLFSTSDSSGTPLYEVQIPTVSASVSDKTVALSIPPILFKSFNITNPNGSALKSVFGTKTAYLGDMVKPTLPKGATATPLDSLAGAQLIQNKAEPFPIKCTSITAAGLSIFGSAFLAYEDQGRVDLAFRPSISAPFQIARDVCFRVPESLQPSDLAQASPAASKQALPEASIPFLVAIPQTASVLLFYQYKGRILVKKIASSVVTSQAADSASMIFPPDVEATISSTIMKSIPSIVYDGAIADQKNGMTGDTKFGTVKFFKQTTAGSAAQNSQQQPRVSQYSVCRTKGGYLYCFLEDNNRIRGRRSTNEGETWEDIFNENAVFLPALKTAAAPAAGTQTGLTDGSAPSCFYDEATQQVRIFFMADSALLMTVIPEKSLAKSQADASAALAKNPPVIIYGDQSDNLKGRGVALSVSVSNRKKASKDFKEAISPHRVAVGRLDQGHLRLFFFDQQQKLRSLISSDGGAQWQTEDQYIKSR